MTEPHEKIIVAVDDMFFAAKIIAAAEHCGKPIERLKSLADIQQSVRNHPPSLVLIDLNATKFDALEIIQWFKGQSPCAEVPIIGFLSHIQVDLKRRAEEAGCNLVLPRSAFSQKLTEILSGSFLQA